MSEQPSPYTTELCTVCDEPWSAHVRLAKSDAEIASEGEYMDSRKDIEYTVTMDYCIYLLKTRNQGPSGPPGPMGMAGRTADETILHGLMTREEFSNWLATRREQ